MDKVMALGWLHSLKTLSFRLNFAFLNCCSQPNPHLFSQLHSSTLLKAEKILNQKLLVWPGIVKEPLHATLLRTRHCI
jgi:hypothetical protein